MFLWFADLENLNSKNISDAEICSYRIYRVLFGVPSSPFRLRGIHPSFVKTFLADLHVHNIVSGADSEKDAYDCL